MSFTISSSINAAALSARHAAPGSNNVRARAFVRAQPKKSVATFSVCADDAFAARVAAAKAAVGGPPPAPMQGLPPKFKAGTAMPPKASMPPPPAPKAEAPANEFSWDSAPSAARQSAPSAAPAARRQAVDLDNVDPDFAPRTNSGYSAPAASYNPTPTSNVVSFGARKSAPVDYDNIDPDFAPKRELVGAASSGYSAPAAASFGGASAAPTKVERRGGVMYDPDQYDSENASRFGRR